MTYELFCKEFKKEVLCNKEWNLNEKDYKFYPDGYTACGDEGELKFIRDTNIKYHSTESDILQGDYVVLYVDEGAFKFHCRFSMKYLFEEYEQGGWERITQIVDENVKTTRSINVNDVLEDFGNYEAIKGRLIIRPLNYTNNKYKLKEILHKVCGDIALVLYVILYDDERGLGTTKIHKEQFEMWQKDFGEVFDEALVNTNIKALPRMYMNPIDTFKPSYEKGAFMSLDSDITEIGRMQVPVVTTTRQINGAIAMFYPGVKEKIADLFGGSFYVAFTSIHDARVHRVGSISPRRILRTLKDVNNAFSHDELLSRKVFLYDDENNSFETLEL